MTDLRAIDPSPLRARYAGPASEVGERPELQWLKISRLRIEPRYQREIGQRGANNILAIAPAFRWTKFTPVVVAPIEGGLFAIVDGQHRTTAAALRGFESVPCVIISADEAQRADAFVAINANVTAMSPLQLHAARLAGGDIAANALTEVCREAGVSICRYPVPANKMSPGETLAVTMLKGALDKYGPDILVAALSCITQTRRGNPGMIRAQIVGALCSVLVHSTWLSDRKALIFAMQSFDFAAQFNAARTRSIATGKKVFDILAAAIGAHLRAKAEPDKTAPAPGPRVAPAKPSVTPAKPVQTAAAPPKNEVVTTGKKGLSVTLTPGREAVDFNGRSLRVSARAARLVEMLARAMPSCLGDSFLIGKLWTVQPSDADRLLDAICDGLDGLKAIGLEVRKQRGVGRQLVEITP